MQKAHLGHICHVEARGAKEQTKQGPQPTQQQIGTMKTRPQLKKWLGTKGSCQITI